MRGCISAFRMEAPLLVRASGSLPLSRTQALYLRAILKSPSIPPSLLIAVWILSKRWRGKWTPSSCLGAFMKCTEARQLLIDNSASRSITQPIAPGPNQRIFFLGLPREIRRQIDLEICPRALSWVRNSSSDKALDICQPVKNVQGLCERDQTAHPRQHTTQTLSFGFLLDF